MLTSLLPHSHDRLFFRRALTVLSSHTRSLATFTLPVFIITWVVARLTFFLKPAQDILAHKFVRMFWLRFV